MECGIGSVSIVTTGRGEVRRGASAVRESGAQSVGRVYRQVQSRHPTVLVNYRAGGGVPEGAHRRSGGGHVSAGPQRERRACCSMRQGRRVNARRRRRLSQQCELSAMSRWRRVVHNSTNWNCAHIHQVTRPKAKTEPASHLAMWRGGRSARSREGGTGRGRNGTVRSRHMCVFCNGSSERLAQLRQSVGRLAHCEYRT